MNRKVRACSFSAQFGGTPPPTGQAIDSGPDHAAKRKRHAEKRVFPSTCRKTSV
nr:MAG TPA: hypothetical protein [Caudoviricetes sp.]